MLAVWFPSRQPPTQRCSPPNRIRNCYEGIKERPKRRWRSRSYLFLLGLEASLLAYSSLDSSSLDELECKGFDLHEVLSEFFGKSHDCFGSRIVFDNVETLYESMSVESVAEAEESLSDSLVSLPLLKASESSLDCNRGCWLLAVHRLCSNFFDLSNNFIFHVKLRRAEENVFLCESLETFIAKQFFDEWREVAVSCPVELVRTNLVVSKELLVIASDRIRVLSHFDALKHTEVANLLHHILLVDESTSLLFVRLNGKERQLVSKIFGWGMDAYLNTSNEVHIRRPEFIH